MLLPTDIQVHILESKAMFRSFDLWFKGFKKLVSANIPNPDELDESDNVFLQLKWEEHFGSTLRVYEKKHQFLGLLINYDDSSYITDDDKLELYCSNILKYIYIYIYILFQNVTVRIESLAEKKWWLERNNKERLKNNILIKK